MSGKGGLTMRSEKLNASGCKDLTAYAAINNVTKEQKNKDKHVSELIKVVKFIIDNAGYKLSNRIVIIDKETGREYK